jgi:RNA polymerase sigma-B factor
VSPTASISPNDAPPTSGAAPAGRRRRDPKDVAHEAALLRRYANTRDPRLKEELAARFMPLARSLAMRYRGGSESLDDLVQVASLGLVKAIDGFDPGRARPFAAYAVPTMLGELRRHFRDHVWNMHLPRGLQERTMAVNDAIQALGDELGSSPTIADIATRLDLGEEEVLEALQADQARRTLSLDAPRANDDSESSPVVETVPTAEMGYESVESQLCAADADLDDRERMVLKLRFGRNLNQYEIGRKLGVSQMQISRIMRRALRKLLHAVQDDEPAPPADPARRMAA